jgi:hypothetical protein
MMGQLLNQIQLGQKKPGFQSTFELDVSDLPGGVYFVQLQNEKTNGLVNLSKINIHWSNP